MNCTHCNAPLTPEARFCRNCGTLVSTAIPQPANAYNAQASQQVIGDSPTVLPPYWETQQPAPVEQQFRPPQTYQPTIAVSPNPGSMPSTGAQFASPPLPMRRRKNRLMQVLLILSVALLIILLVLVAGWFAVLRPYLHGVAQSEINGVFTSAFNQVSPVDAAVITASRAPVVITESDANAFIATNSSQSDPIQQVHMTITPTGLRLDFQAYGFTSTITGVPQAVNGQLVMTNVTVQGMTSFIMSPDELTTTLNAHLHQISTVLHRSVSGVILKNHEMDVQLR
jgi:hypothetical protein